MRGERMTLEVEGLSRLKNRITDETLNLLMQLAKESDLRVRIDAMFRGGENQHYRKPGRFAWSPCALRKESPSLSMAIPQDGSDESCPLKWHQAMII